jgi:serine phosphatase RsbU (regulator of sigma subunit)
MKEQQAVPRLEDVLEENRYLREQLDAKAKVAARALAAQQRRVLEMEQAASELAAVNDKLAAALRVLEERDHRISEDLAQAWAFQRLMLPRLPPPAALRFAALYRPAEVVGGDLYDVCRVTGGGHRVFIADAIGHGVQAAMRTMILKTEYDRVRDAATPARALVELNRRISAAYPGLELQCTAACFDVNADGPVTHVAYATAAHPPLIVVSPDGAARQVYQAAPFLGVIPDIEITPVHFELRRGERLFALSDGLVEETKDDKEFGVERLLAALARPELSLEDTMTSALAALEEFVGGTAMSDDITLIGIEVQP